MVNGTAPEESEAISNAQSQNQDVGAEFKYLRKKKDKEQNTSYVFSYTVKSGDTPIGIAKKFNVLDAKLGDNYRNIIFKTGVVNSRGYFVGNAINPGQEVYIVAEKY
jgi:hypothetical protein